MDMTFVVMWFGFTLAAYSVVGNDVIQTLGTFLTSNEKRVPWYVLWAYAGSIMLAVLVWGWLQGDIDYGRLDKFDFPDTYAWYYLLPPLVLMIITRFGIPVSTTFMILTLFSLAELEGELGAMAASVFDTSTILGGMIKKSLFGYLIAFVTALLVYLGISKLTERYFLDNPLQESRRPIWLGLQWLTTGFLWSQWLTQDLANIYIYLRGGMTLDYLGLGVSILILVGLLGYIFYSKGGAVQDVVRSKTNTDDIRSATFVDFIYAFLLLVFKGDALGIWGAKLPMSTTWLFVGLLAGREIGIRLRLAGRIERSVLKLVATDFGKIILGLVVSVILVFVIKLLAG